MSSRKKDKIEREREIERKEREMGSHGGAGVAEASAGDVLTVDPHAADVVGLLVQSDVEDVGPFLEVRLERIKAVPSSSDDDHPLLLGSRSRSLRHCLLYGLNPMGKILLNIGNEAMGLFFLRMNVVQKVVEDGRAK
jgi:hypothetical protein